MMVCKRRTVVCLVRHVFFKFFSLILARLNLHYVILKCHITFFVKIDVFILDLLVVLLPFNV